MCVECRQRPAHHTTQLCLCLKLHNEEWSHLFIAGNSFIDGFPGYFFPCKANARNKNRLPGMPCHRLGVLSPLVSFLGQHIPSPLGCLFVNPRQAISCLLWILTPFHWKLPMLAVIGKGSIAPSSWCPPSASSGSAFAAPQTSIQNRLSTFDVLLCTF